MRYLGHSSGCGVSDDVEQWMTNVQNSAVEDESPAPPPTKKKHKKANPTYPTEINSANYENGLNKYSRLANDEHHRARRATRRGDENKKTCSLYIQTDPLIWRHIRESFPEVCHLFKQIFKVRLCQAECFHICKNLV